MVRKRSVIKKIKGIPLYISENNPAAILTPAELRILRSPTSKAAMRILRKLIRHNAFLARDKKRHFILCKKYLAEMQEVEYSIAHAVIKDADE